MKIDEMNREQLRDHMKGNGTIHRFNQDSAEWKHAFRLIKKSGHENLDMYCQKCVGIVQEWIKK